jgi:hypothetical protein
MGFFSFLRSGRNLKLESLNKELSFSEIKELVEKKLLEKREKEKEILKSLEILKENFVNEISEKIEILRSKKPDSERADERVKLIVEENKERYILHLENLIKKLKEIEAENLESFKEKVNEIFLKLHEKSYKNYWKTSVLIRKEIFAINNGIKNFSKSILETFDENLVRKIDNLKEISTKIKEEENISLKIKEIEKIIEFFRNKLKNKEEEREKISSEIKKVENSEEYLKNLENLENLKKLEEKLERNIFRLRNNINFKELTNFFHIFPEKMKIVKNYRENFLEEFKNDKPKILNLMKESNLRIFNLNEILEEIDNLGEEIKRNKGEIIPNKIIPLKRDEESIILETNSLNEEIKEKEKLIVNLEENKKKLIEDINFSFKEKN